jgi:hypothetical protein
MGFTNLTTLRAEPFAGVLDILGKLAYEVRDPVLHTAV